MTLATDVTARLPAARLKQLTNLGNPAGATSIDTAKLAIACTDTEAAFELWGQQAYDGTDKRHVAIGAKGVIAYLKEYGGQEEASKEMGMLRTSLEQLAATTVRARLEPETSSQLTPSADPQDADGVSRPWSDRTHFDDLSPRSPGSRDASDDFFYPE